MTKGKKRVTLSASDKARKKARFLSLFKGSPVTIDDNDDSLTEIYFCAEGKCDNQICEKSLPEPWSDKYRPQCVSEMAGDHEKLGQLRKFIEEWGRHESNIVPLIYGEPGIGKTSLAYAIAKDMEYQVYEINCGMTSKIVDLTEKLHQSINNSQVSRGDAQISPWTASQDAIKQFSKVILNSKSLVLFDDIDCMVYEEENGFWKALNHLIQDSNRPILLTATRHNELLESLIESLEVFKIDPPSDNSVLAHIKEICSKENHQLTDNESISSVNYFHGDIRKALNECQFYDGKLASPEPSEMVINFEQRLHYDVICLSDLLNSRNLSENSVSAISDISDYLKELDSKLIVASELTYDKKQNRLPTSFKSKVGNMTKKFNRFMSHKSVCLNFSPYLSIIECSENNRRYRTRGSRSQSTVTSDDGYIFSMTND